MLKSRLRNNLDKFGILSGEGNDKIQKSRNYLKQRKGNPFYLPISFARITAVA